MKRDLSQCDRLAGEPIAMTPAEENKCLQRELKEYRHLVKLLNSTAKHGGARADATGVDEAQPKARVDQMKRYIRECDRLAGEPIPTSPEEEDRRLQSELKGYRKMVRSRKGAAEIEELVKTKKEEEAEEREQALQVCCVPFSPL